MADKVIFLLENDKAIRADVAASVSMLNFSVKAFEDTAKLLSALKDEKPECIITRVNLGDHNLAGVALAESVLHHGYTGPIVAACTNSESSAIKGHEAMFSGVLSVPVQFPSFTFGLRDLLTPDAQTDAKMVRIKAEQIVNKIEPEEAESPLDHKREENLLLVYKIHHQIIKELERQDSFGSLEASQVPAILLDITRKVCATVALSGVSK